MKPLPTQDVAANTGAKSSLPRLPDGSGWSLRIDESLGRLGQVDLIAFGIK